jgi:hypothetical protein
MSARNCAPGAAPDAARAATPEHVFATVEDDEADVPLLLLNRNPGKGPAAKKPVCAEATSEGCRADSVVPVPAAAAPPVSGGCKPRRNGRHRCGSGGRGMSLKAGTTQSRNEESDDERPLFPGKVSELNQEQKTKVILNENPWSMDFAIACSDLMWYGNPEAPYPVWQMKALDTAVYGKGSHASEVTITRRASPYLAHLLNLKGCVVYPGISFVVQARSDKNYYLLFNDYAGACLVMVDKIMPPDEDARTETDKYKETISYRRVFTTEEAVKNSKSKKDKGVYMGNAFFRRKLLQEQTISDELGAPFTTYHIGDAYYTGDIRTIVGVVRWKSEGANDLAEDYFAEYLQADLVNTGANVVQNYPAHDSSPQTPPNPPRCDFFWF